MKPLTLPELAQELLSGDNYVMLTHRRPDGDTIGSAAALTRGLRALGKRAFVLENPQFAEKFRPYLDGLTLDEVPQDCHLVAVDIAAESLFPFGSENYVNQIAYRIDHHGSRADFAQKGYVDPKAAACGEIVLALLEAMGVIGEKATAEALYLAISTDTGCFRYSNVTANTLRSAARCMDWGADTFAINQTMFLTKRLPRLKLDAHLARNIEFYAGGLVAVCAIDPGVRAELGITEDDIDDISGFPREIEGVQIGVMLRQEGEDGKISLRTSPNYDASAICALLGGGGHKAAAGATVPGGIAAAKDAVLRALRQYGVRP